jgi:hypothetical protein
MTYGHNSCMMKQEFLFLIKLYNRNFLSDDHYIPRKSWIQDASEGLAQMQSNMYGAYILKAGSNLFMWDKW